MTVTTSPVTEQVIVYPDSDRQPMADNTLQFRWIVTIQGGFDALFRDRADVFVAGDLLWYPVEGEPKIRRAPDALIAFGRPKGYRGSYKQWQEDDIPPQVVFEVLSPGNTAAELIRKWRFYAEYGVEEYYIYDPERGELSGWLRTGPLLAEIESMEGWVSPRTGVRFGLEGADLVLLRPDGRRFASYLEVVAAQEAAEHARAEAETARDAAEVRAVQAQHERDAAEARAARLAERLRALGLDPEA